MKKVNIIFIILLLVFLVLLYRSLTDREVLRVGELTYKTAERSGPSGNNLTAMATIDRERFPPKRGPLKMAPRGIFKPLSFGFKKKPAKASRQIAAKAPAIVLSSNLVNIETKESEEIIVSNAAGAINTTLSVTGIASLNLGAASITISCENEGETSVNVSDGNSSADISVICRLRMPEKKLARLTFLGFLKSENEKSIFLSREPDKEILIVKKGDTIIQKSDTILYDYYVKSISDDKIVIASSDNSDSIEISLVENKPLKQERKE